jgi:hypothetical protein
LTTCRHFGTGITTVRFPFGRSPRRRELEEIQKRVAQLWEEISRLEQTAEDLPEDMDTSDAYRSVQRLRGSMAREELVSKRAELRQLEERASELESDIAIRPTGTFPAFNPEAQPDAQAGDVSALNEGGAALDPNRPLPAELAIIEPVLTDDTADETASLDVATDDEPPVAEEPVEAFLEPKPLPPEPNPVVVPVEELIAEVVEPEPAPEALAEAHLAEAKESTVPPRRRTGPVVALVVLVLLVLGAAGGIASGQIPLSPPPTPSPSIQSPVAIVPTAVPVPTRPASPTAAPPTLTSVPSTPVPPTVVPPTEVLPTPFPTETPPEIEPEPEFAPNVEPSIASTVILAPPGFTGAWLRTQPSMTAPAYRLLPNGTRVDLLEGAETASGFRWNRVRTADGLAGWVVATTLGS